MTKTAAGWRNISLGTKLAIHNFLLVTIVVTVLILAIGYSTSKVMESSVTMELSEKTKILVDLIESSDKELRDRTAVLAKGFQTSLSGKFKRDAATVEIKGLVTPVLMLEGVALNLNYAVVDRFTASAGAVATLFVKSGDDFVRVSTSLKNEQGERAVGTLLDRAHPGYKATMAGGSFVGLATLFGRQYMAQYDPIKDAQGAVVGLSFVGLDFTDYLGNLKSTIRNLKIGKAGYFYVLDARPGHDYGNVLIHPVSEGKNLLNAKDADGRRQSSQITGTRLGRNGGGV